jgi:hypothetical protein
MNKCAFSTGISTSCVVTNEEEFDKCIGELFYELLDRATAHTRRFLRETGQWQNDTVHEKLAQRWGYELLERFMINARCDVPCRPVHLFDSFISRYYSQPDSCLTSQFVGSPICRFLDGLFSRAVHSRDATVAIFYHLYGLGQQEVAKILGLGIERQRVYKNYLRWRSKGWTSMVEGIGLKDSDISQILEQKRRNPDQFRREIEQVVYTLQSHYRKSEPIYYPCLKRSEWKDLYEQGVGFDYKGWHLPFCQACFTEVCNLRHVGSDGSSQSWVDLQIYPMPKVGVTQSCLLDNASSKAAYDIA